MFTDIKKLDLIARLLNEKNEQILKSVEDILSKPLKESSGHFAQFTNKLSDEEIAVFEQNIEIGCEQVNESDWK